MSGENGSDTGSSIGSDAGVSSSASSDGDIDFSGMDSALDGDYGDLGAGMESNGDGSPAPSSAQTDSQSSQPPAPAAKDGEGAPKSATPNATAPNPAEKQPVEAAPSPSQPKEAGTPEPKTAPGATPPSELDAFLSDITQNEAAFVQHLAEKDFKLSPEMVQALADGQGETMIPRIVAGGALWAVKSMTNIFKQTIPKIIEAEVSRITQEQTLRKDAEDRFFSKWPQLSRDKHFPDIQQISHALRAANPNITFDDLVSLTGAAVMAKHGIVAQSGNPQAPKPNGGNAFVPAAGARVVSQVPVDQNPFAGMSQDYDD